MMVDLQLFSQIPLGTCKGVGKEKADIRKPGVARKVVRWLRWRDICTYRFLQSCF